MTIEQLLRDSLHDEAGDTSPTSHAPDSIRAATARRQIWRCQRPCSAASPAPP